MTIEYINYPKCTTCKKAKTWLDNNGIKYNDRHIKEQNPTFDELQHWVEKSGLEIKKFFNTSGVLYKEMGFSTKLKDMSHEEKLQLLSSDGMLVKRPILVSEDFVLVGFKEEVWLKTIQK